LFWGFNSANDQRISPGQKDKKNMVGRGERNIRFISRKRKKEVQGKSSNLKEKSFPFYTNN